MTLESNTREYRTRPYEHGLCKQIGFIILYNILFECNFSTLFYLLILSSNTLITNSAENVNSCICCLTRI